MRRLLPALMVLVFVMGVAAVVIRFEDPTAPDAPLAQTPARMEVLDLTFEHFDGRVVRLSDWTGTPMVVNFWASWCPPCVAEMSQAFEPVHQRLGDRVAVVGLNVEDTPDRAAQIVAQTGVTYELGRDPVGELFAGFGGFGMPTTVFIDQVGVVVETHTGALSAAQLEDIVARSLGVQSP